MTSNGDCAITQGVHAQSSVDPFPNPYVRYSTGFAKKVDGCNDSPLFVGGGQAVRSCCADALGVINNGHKLKLQLILVARERELKYRYDISGILLHTRFFLPLHHRFGFPSLMIHAFDPRHVCHRLFKFLISFLACLFWGRCYCYIFSLIKASCSFRAN